MLNVPCSSRCAASSWLRATLDPTVSRAFTSTTNAIQEHDSVL